MLVVDIYSLELINRYVCDIDVTDVMYFIL